MVKSRTQIRRIVDDYKAELKRHNIKVSQIILYGSYARGNPRYCSDIDLVVVSSDFKKFHSLKRQELLAELTMDIDAPLEVIGYTPQELRRSKDTIFGQILKETGKVLRG